MRKNVYGRQFKRDKNERTALFKGLISSLVLHERIKTTEDKAKAIKGEADKIITKAKKGGVLARHLLQGQLPERAIEKVIFEITPRFSKRQGGYTRIIRIGRRFSDNASMVLMEWTEQKLESRIKNPELKEPEDKETEKGRKTVSDETTGKKVSTNKVEKTKTKK